MQRDDENTVLPVPLSGLPPAVLGAVHAWADATTDASSERRRDLLRDKGNAVLDFLASTEKPLDQARSADVKAWQAALEARGLSPASVYARVSRVSSFFRWAMRDQTVAEKIRRNPADLARPKAPRTYQSESAQALDDEQVRRLLDVVKKRADAGSVTAKRDYALTLLFFLTGLRRSEVMRLRWRDIEINGSVVLLRTLKLKGGDYRSREVRHRAVRDALVEYLTASARLNTMRPESPLWTRHDRAGKPGTTMTSHAFVLNLKRYAAGAGIERMHLHQTRHTFARMVSEDMGSLLEVQDALGHRSASTTRVYVQRVAIKRDRYSQALGMRLGV